MRGFFVGVSAISLRSKAMAPAPAWMIGVAVLIVELVLVLAIMTAANYRDQVRLYDRLSAQEPMLDLLDLLHNASAKIVPLTGRSGAGVRLVYSPSLKRGVLLVASLGSPGDEFSYRLWLVGRDGSRTAWAFQSGSDDLTIVPISADFNRYHRVTISVEQRDASRSTVPILSGSL